MIKIVNMNSEDSLTILSLPYHIKNGTLRSHLPLFSIVEFANIFPKILLTNKYIYTIYICSLYSIVNGNKQQTEDP